MDLFIIGLIMGLAFATAAFTIYIQRSTVVYRREEPDPWSEDFYLEQREGEEPRVVTLITHRERKIEL
jgi:hypothetical protein